MRVLLALLFLMPALSWSQSSEGRSFWYARIGPSFGQPVLGSEDTRRGTVYAIGFSRPEPAFRFRGLQGDMMLEAYYMFTKGGGFEDIPVNNMHSFGAMMVARYHTHWLRNADAHFDLGWGMVYNNFTTRDLDSQLNSTPCIGVGLTWGKIDFTIRWYHQSNAGTHGHNQGTNQIQYLLSYRF